MIVEPYVMFGGKCAQAFAYYQEHLGATDPMIMPFRGTPAEAGAPPDWLDKAMHASIKFGSHTVMGSDGMPGQPPTPMQGCSLTISIDSDAEAERIFKALSDGGKVTMPMEQTFFASRFGSVTDRFGVSWMVIHEGAR